MFMSRSLCPQGKRPRYPWDRRLGGLQSRSGHGGEEDKSLHCARRDMNPIRNDSRRKTSVQRLTVVGYHSPPAVGRSCV
jgi:hypothetical protein